MVINKNDEFEIEITDLGSEGEGIGRFDGMPFFIKGAIPGDKILAGVTKMKKTYGYARIVKILTPSLNRVTPACPIAGRCGGCQLQHMTYEAQLNYKQNKVLNDLVRIGGIEREKFELVPFHKAEEDWENGRAEAISFLPIIDMEEPWHYRNKGQFPVGVSKDGNIISGFYAGHTHSIIDTKRCLLQHELTDSLMQAVRDYMSEAGVSAYEEPTTGVEQSAKKAGVSRNGKSVQTGVGKNKSIVSGVGSGLVRHVLTRVGFTTHEVMVCVVINGDKLPQAELLTEKLQHAVDSYNSTSKISQTVSESKSEQKVGGSEGNAYRLASLTININKKDTNVILGDECRVLYGNMYITDYIGDIKYRISPLSFYQVNPVQTRRLYSAALDFACLTGNEVVWDLYCGIGTISLFLAQKAKKVYGVEIVPQAIDDAKENAVLNGIDNAEFFVGAAEEVLPAKYASDPSMRADVIVVDPPRKGCDIALLDCMVKLSPERIVYVSCDPATLARDVKILCGNGYELVCVQPCDMFPNSFHVETVVLLTRVN